MAATFPAGMAERARFIEGAVGFRLSYIRNSKRLLRMTNQEIIAEREAFGFPIFIGLSLESERYHAEQIVSRGFRMQDVRSYADEIASEHRQSVAPLKNTTPARPGR